MTGEQPETPAVPGVTRWRKRPVEVEAIQWTGGNLADVQAFCGPGHFDAVPPGDRDPDPDMTAQVYDELHGTWVHVYDGQWVIRGVQGELYPCAAVVFAATYEPAGEPLVLPPDATVRSVQRVLDWALTSEAVGGDGEGVASDVAVVAAQRNAARSMAVKLEAQLARSREATRMLGSIVAGHVRAMEAARIEMLQNGPQAAMQWILNSQPDLWDDPETAWNGTESADEWFDRVEAAFRAAESAADGPTSDAASRALPVVPESAQGRPGATSAEAAERDRAGVKLAAVIAELKACMAGFFTHYGNSTAASLNLARDLAEGIRQILDRDSSGTAEEPFTADAGQPSAADRAMVARATGGGIRSGEVQPAFEGEEAGRG